MKSARLRFAVALVASLSLAWTAGCGDHSYHFISFGTAPVGGTFPVMGGAMADVLNAHPPTEGDWANWKVQTKGTKGTQENIRRLSRGEFELGLSNSAISYFAYRGEQGWEKAYDVRAIATLTPLAGVFITRPDTGIEQISDLKGKRICIGPAGAGFEMFVRPILEEHGVPWDSITALNDPQSVAVDRLGDGAADAVFMGGVAGQPHPSITQAMGSFDVKFIPYDQAARKRLVERYPFYQLHVISAKTRDGKEMYRGMTEDFDALIVGNVQIVADKSTPKELIRTVIETLCNNSEEVIKNHPVGRGFNPNVAPRYVGIPFHEGAIEFYRNWPGVKPGIWEPPSAGDSPDTKAAAAPTQPASKLATAQEGAAE